MSDANDRLPIAVDGDRPVPAWTPPELRETDISWETRTSLSGGGDGSGGLS